VTTNSQVLLPGVTLSASTFQSSVGINQVTGALAARVLGTGLNSQPAASTVTTELGNLITTLCTSPSQACTSLARVQAVATAACAAALGSSDVLIN
jgi:hypothetical protein